MNILFLIIVILILFGMIKNISERSYNNSQPQLQHTAIVLTKKSEDTIHHSTVNDLPNTTINTSYYIIFQLSSGEQRKIHVQYQLYTSVKKGDQGILTLQGSRFISFEPKTNLD